VGIGDLSLENKSDFLMIMQELGRDKIGGPKGLNSMVLVKQDNLAVHFD
jgi:hypothetical protein